MTIHLNQGHIAAIILAIGLTIWMLLGAFSSEQPYQNPRPLVLDDGLQRVQVERMEGSLTQRTVSFSAHTAANRRVELRSEIRGKVIAIHALKGAQVKAGDLLVELDARDWPARVKQAEATFKQRSIEARSMKQLAERDLANQAQIAQAETALANAEAELTHAKNQLNATKIRAPFAGIVDQRFVEIGDFIGDNTRVITVLDFSPWLVKGQVSEREAAYVHIGDKAYAELVTGERVEGRIRFISAEADAQTRTFAVEMEAISANGNMNSGITARIHVPQPDTYAYFISPALLVLNDKGQLGLKGIDDKNKVIFRAVDLLKADDKGLWVHGLGANANIITVGQGFVEYGQSVQPVYTNNERAADSIKPSDNTVMSVE